MKITKEELKELIKECLKEELEFTDKDKTPIVDVKEEVEDESDETPLEMALMCYESGHRPFERRDFKSDEDYKEFLEYMEYGPAGFFEEFKNELDFSQEFIDEYSDSVDEDEDYYDDEDEDYYDDEDDEDEDEDYYDDEEIELEEFNESIDIEAAIKGNPITWDKADEERYDYEGPDGENKEDLAAYVAYILDSDEIQLYGFADENEDGDWLIDIEGNGDYKWYQFVAGRLFELEEDQLG